MLFSLAIIGFMVFVALLARGPDEIVASAIDRACNEPIDGYSSLREYGKAIFENMVDKKMCTEACPCDPGTPIEIQFTEDKTEVNATYQNISFSPQAVWETYGLDFVRSYARVYTADQLSEEEREAFEETPDLAPYTPFQWGPLEERDEEEISA